MGATFSGAASSCFINCTKARPPPSYDQKERNRKRCAHFALTRDISRGLNPVVDESAAQTKKIRPRTTRTLRVVLAVLLLGAVLRSVQYFAGIDLWHDELAVARNVADRGLGDLVSRPLDHHQVAPPGFLLSV